MKTRDWDQANCELHKDGEDKVLVTTTRNQGMT